MARPPLTAPEIAKWLHDSADEFEAMDGFPPEASPRDFADSYVSPVAALVRVMVDHFPEGRMTLGQWEAIDRRMREFLGGA